MNGAELLIRSAASAGVDVCFANPGTTELPMVAAFDQVPSLRPILALFEGVATGAADGYGRLSGRPAMTLMHLGPSLGNGLANLHNAKRARSPVLNVVGDHPRWHRPFDPPLASDIGALAGTVSSWVRTSSTADSLGADVVDAVAAALPGQVATLIVPADTQWDEARTAVPTVKPRSRPVSAAAAPLDVERVCHALRQPTAALLLGGRALQAEGLRQAQRIASATGCRLLAETFVSRIEWGAGLPLLERVPYVPRMAQVLFSGLSAVVLAGASRPVAFFAEPGVDSLLIPPTVPTLVAGEPTAEMPEILREIADTLGAPKTVSLTQRASPGPAADGPLTVPSIVAAIAAVQPEGLIFVDEGVSAGGAHLKVSGGCPPFTYLSLTGGATGQGLPCAIGAAIACPDRRVLAFVGDGAAMYTVQALWTHARESLNITTVILSNQSYKILELEMKKRATVGPRAKSLIDLAVPPLQWVEVARGLGVPAVSVAETGELTRALTNAFMTQGPNLIEAKLR